MVNKTTLREGWKDGRKYEKIIARLNDFLEEIDSQYDEVGYHFGRWIPVERCFEDDVRARLSRLEKSANELLTQVEGVFDRALELERKYSFPFTNKSPAKLRFRRFKAKYESFCLAIKKLKKRITIIPPDKLKEAMRDGYKGPFFL